VAREKARGEAKTLEMKLASSSLASRKKSSSGDYEVGAVKPSLEDLVTPLRSTGDGFLLLEESNREEAR
jgi:hypothetical protein